MTLRRQSLIGPDTARAVLGVCLIFSFIALSAETSPAQTLPNWNRECKKLFRQFDKKPRHRAFAVSDMYSSSMVQSCGLAWSASSEKAAEANAIKACRQSGGSRCVIKVSE